MSHAAKRQLAGAAAPQTAGAADAQQSAFIRWLGDHAGKDKCEILCAAVAERRSEMIPLLVRCYGVTGADAHARDCAPLVAACAGGDLDLVWQLVDTFAYTDDEVAAGWALRGGPAGGDAAPQVAAFVRWLGPHAGKSKRDILCAALVDGRGDLLSVLIRHYGVARADACAYNCLPLAEACGRGDLATAQHLAREFALTNAEVAASRALCAACKGGHRDVIEWLRTTFNLTAAHLCALSGGNWPEALAMPCRFAEAQFVKWLMCTFDVTRADAGKGIDHLVCDTCSWRRDLETIEWILERLDVTAADLRRALSSVMDHGALEVLSWLLSRYAYAFTKADVALKDYLLLREACLRNHLPKAQMLVDHFGITAADLDEAGRETMRDAAHHGMLDVVHWLRDRLGIGAGDPRTNDESLLYAAVLDGQKEVVNWLWMNRAGAPLGRRHPSTPEVSRWVARYRG